MKRLSMRILQSQLPAYQRLGWTEVKRAAEWIHSQLAVTLVEHDNVHACHPCRCCDVALDYTAFTVGAKRCRACFEARI